MELVADEDIDIGEDLTPQLLPISYALHDSFLNTHCSSCFSPLPVPNPDPHCDLLYCSPVCSSSASSIHFSATELHLLRLPSSLFTSDLRVALGLLHSYPFHRHDSTRISRLLTNYYKFVTITDDDDEMFARIRNGSRAMAAVRRLSDGKTHVHKNENEEENGNVSLLFEEEAVALCSVITNGVEVQDNQGRNIGVAVYDFNFSWINHSCSPNACYRFVFSPSFPAVDDTTSSRLSSRLVPRGPCIDLEFRKVCGNYGPRIIVRSIKRINKHEEVTVAYTDLLQPKAIRQSELWSKYHFSCCCVRCDVSPPSYVDRVLQEVSASNQAISSSNSNLSFYRDKAARKLIDHVEKVITDYLSSSDPESCCKKLENMLIYGFLDELLETEAGQPQFNIKVHPLHHLALNAYMTLASAYKMHASDLIALNSESNEHQFEIFDMLRISAAYSYLLAVATYHLFCFEFSLISSVANFWTSVGESLLTFTRSSSVWNSFRQRELNVSKPSFLGKTNCSKCSCMDRFEANLSFRRGLDEDFEKISCKFVSCITSLSRETWSCLIRGSHYLNMFKDPMDLRHWNMPAMADFQANIAQDNMGAESWTKETTTELETNFSHQERVHLFQLGVHSLLYGEFLATICYDKQSHRTRHIRNLLYDEEILN